jgi:hypothetical protein
MLDKLTLSAIDEYIGTLKNIKRKHRIKSIRDYYKKNLIQYTIRKNIDKGLEMIRKSKYWDLLSYVYDQYPTPESMYKIYSLIFTVRDLDDKDISNFLYDMQSTITPTIEGLFREYNKYYLLLKYLDP